jgi:iron(II)-dependent oxidoreductase
MIHGEIMNANLRSMKIEELSQALQAARATTLRLFQALEAADHEHYWQHRDPAHAEINPYIWEAGHVAWFQEYWVARNPQRAKGLRYCPETRHRDSSFPNADTIFNSAIAPPFMRSQVSIEMQQQLRQDLQYTLDTCLNALQADAPRDPEGLYFYRLVLAHELMHIESLRIMGQVLGVALTNNLIGAAPTHNDGGVLVEQSIDVRAKQFALEFSKDEFCFDNELPERPWTVEGFEIDRYPVSHGQFAEFIEEGGYGHESLWSPKGWAWRRKQGLNGPRWFRIRNGVIERYLYGQWRAVDAQSPMVHVSLYEAQAFCEWVKRKLPTEAQWLAGCQASMSWGSVWEWTADTFTAFDGFVPHPYREYSEPWFITHQLVKGASLMTPPPLQDFRYRNFYCAHRNDVAIGFRTVRDW